MNHSTRSTSFNLVSYARAHDYYAPNAGSEPAKWTDRRENPYLRVVLDEVTSVSAYGEGASVTNLVMRVANISGDMNSNSQGMMQNETYESLDLSLYRSVLNNITNNSSTSGEQNKYPMRVGYHDRLAVVRYQFPASLPAQNGPIGYRRFQLEFQNASDLEQLIKAIQSYCFCFDPSTKKKQTQNKNARSANTQAPIGVPSRSQAPTPAQPLIPNKSAFTQPNPNYAALNYHDPYAPGETFSRPLSIGPIPQQLTGSVQVYDGYVSQPPSQMVQTSNQSSDIRSSSSNSMRPPLYIPSRTNSAQSQPIGVLSQPASGYPTPPHQRTSVDLSNTIGVAPKLSNSQNPSYQPEGIRGQLIAQDDARIDPRSHLHPQTDTQVIRHQTTLSDADKIIRALRDTSNQGTMNTVLSMSDDALKRILGDVLADDGFFTLVKRIERNLPTQPPAALQ